MDAQQHEGLREYVRHRERPLCPKEWHSKDGRADEFQCNCGLDEVLAAHESCEAMIRELRQREAWAASFECPKCGPCSYSMVTTKKTCLHCDSMLMRSKSPLLTELEAEVARLRQERDAIAHELDVTQRLRREEREQAEQRLSETLQMLKQVQAWLQTPAEADDLVPSELEYVIAIEKLLDTDWARAVLEEERR